jgi:hypothetical protein
VGREAEANFFFFFFFKDIGHWPVSDFKRIYIVT